MLIKQELKVIKNSFANNIIGKATQIQGDIETNGNIRIEGKLIGKIRTKSKIVLGSSSYVEGVIYAQNAEIAGELKGKIEVKELLVLKASSIVDGKIKATTISVEIGAVIKGDCRIHKKNSSSLSSIITGKESNQAR